MIANKFLTDFVNELKIDITVFNRKYIITIKIM